MTRRERFRRREAFSSQEPRGSDVRRASGSEDERVRKREGFRKARGGQARKRLGRREAFRRQKPRGSWGVGRPSG
ncbi:hypothetical protein GCM10010116_31010 [Microbispora rosea subsp. aerata]|nr:hypothetical protein GCM10010116_31010 [Microbispora rosea subsp. aerata]GIH57582.1 hypothetical protein Mro02_44960 [Microbispora rosea subsp. aerata]GLJ85553.1 hypothetical protein GCM10017588_42860 [Microbispora rosea subsp. aerata]